MQHEGVYRIVHDSDVVRFKQVNVVCMLQENINVGLSWSMKEQKPFFVR